jgi:hypothetical protein
MEITIVRVDKVSEACVLCDALDILQIDDIHRALGGPLKTNEIPIAQLMGNFRFHLQRLRHTLKQAYDRAPSIKVRCLLTRCRQTLGWSGKNMLKHLREAKNYKEALVAQHQREEVERQNLECIYPIYFQNAIALRPLIDDFLKIASLYTHGRSKENTIEFLLLRRMQGGGYISQKNWIL